MAAFKNRETNLLVYSTECLQCTASQGFLIPKVIGRKCQYLKSPFFILLIEFFERFKLSCEQTLTRCIDDQQNLSFKISKRFHGSIELQSIKVIYRFHIVLI